MAQSKGFLFQFHKGTIRTEFATPPTALFNSFQFHKGTIRTLSEEYREACWQDFNSIKVRLEQILRTSI